VSLEPAVGLLLPGLLLLVEVQRLLRQSVCPLMALT
jgi:hypothetical protein